MSELLAMMASTGAGAAGAGAGGAATGGLMAMPSMAAGVGSLAGPAGAAGAGAAATPSFAALLGQSALKAGAPVLGGNLASRILPPLAPPPSPGLPRQAGGFSMAPAMTRGGPASPHRVPAIGAESDGKPDLDTLLKLLMSRR